MTSCGYAHYIDEVLCVYRKETGISVTDNWKKQNEESLKYAEERIRLVLKMLDDYNIYTEYKYQYGINKSKEICELKLKVAGKRYKEIIKNSKLRRYYRIIYKDRLGIKLFVKAYISLLLK